METKLDYELWIKGREAKIGSELWFNEGDGISKVTIDKISIFKFQSPQVRLKNEKNKYTFFRIDDLEFIEYSLYWEKPIIYQLPDTDGNLSEVKVGQLVWCKRHNENPLSCKIIGFDKSDIVIESQQHTKKVFNVNNISGLGLAVGVTTNKPSRFHGKQDWSQAPEKTVAWAIGEDGESYWFEGNPRHMCWDSPDVCYMAGYRNDLIDDRENMKVTDWRDSLVERPR